MIRNGTYNMILEKSVLYLRTTLLRDVTGLLLDASCFVSSACHTIYLMYILYFVQLFLVLNVMGGGPHLGPTAPKAAPILVIFQRL